MKRAAWLGSLVAIVALASVGCAVQVDGQGQDEPVGSASQSLGNQANSLSGSAGDSTASGSGQVESSNPGRPTPDPWAQVGPAKPTPDPWHPGCADPKSSASDGSQTGSQPSGTAQSGAVRTSVR